MSFSLPVLSCLITVASVGSFHRWLNCYLLRIYLVCQLEKNLEKHTRKQMRVAKSEFILLPYTFLHAKYQTKI